MKFTLYRDHDDVRQVELPTPLKPEELLEYEGEQYRPYTGSEWKQNAYGLMYVHHTLDDEEVMGPGS